MVVMDMLVHVKFDLAVKVNFGIVHGFLVAFLGARVGMGFDDGSDGGREALWANVAVDRDVGAANELDGGVDCVTVVPDDSTSADV